MADNLILMLTVIALLSGIAIGKAWERYKLQEGRWIDRRKARESPHYILGLNFLVSNQIDLAIEELTQAAGLDSTALEIHLILGNLYRERGQVSKAIQLHQTLLQRSKLSRLEHAYVLLCLGLSPLSSVAFIIFFFTVSHLIQKILPFSPRGDGP